MSSGLSYGGLCYEFNLVNDICCVICWTACYASQKTTVSHKSEESYCTLGYSCNSTFSIKLYRNYAALCSAYKSTNDRNDSCSWFTRDLVVNGSPIYCVSIKSLAALVLQGFL